MKELYVYINDIIDVTNEIKEFDIDIFKESSYINGYNLVLDLGKMGINPKSDWEFTIIKMIRHYIEKNYENGIDLKEMKKDLESKELLIIEGRY